MVAGHLQKKKGYWYIVLNLHDENGKRKIKWIATHLPIQGNRRRAEEMLLQARQQHTDLYGRNSDQLLFSDYMLQWLAGRKDKVSPTTYQNYKYVIEKGICPYFQERQTSLQTLRAVDLEEYYAELQKRGCHPTPLCTIMQTSTNRSGTRCVLIWSAVMWQRSRNDRRNKSTCPPTILRMR